MNSEYGTPREDDGEPCAHPSAVEDVTAPPCDANTQDTLPRESEGTRTADSATGETRHTQAIDPRRLTVILTLGDSIPNRGMDGEDPTLQAMTDEVRSDPGCAPAACGLMIQEYSACIRKERDESAWGAGGAVKTWYVFAQSLNVRCLVKDTGNKVEVLASCPTQRVAVLLKRPNEDEVDSGVFHGIQSLYVQPEHRGNNYGRRLQAELHYLLAKPSASLTYPAEWGAPSKIPEAALKDVPPADGSCLFSVLDESYYQNSLIRGTDRGWKFHTTNAGPVTWEVKAQGELPLSMDKFANSLGWKVLREHDLPALTRLHADTVRSQLKMSSGTKSTLIHIDPTSPGVFTNIRGTAELWGKIPPWCQDTAQEPVGLQKGDAFALFTRYTTAGSDIIQITYTHALSAEDVPDLGYMMDVMSHGTDATQVRMWDVDPDGEIAAKLQEKRHAEIGVAEGNWTPPLAYVYYGGLVTGDEGVIASDQLRHWC